MSTQIPDGHLGNVTPEQDAKLRQLWQTVFKLYELIERRERELPNKPLVMPNKPGRGLFGKSGSIKDQFEAGSIEGEIIGLFSSTGVDDNEIYDLAKKFYPMLETQTTETVRAMVVESIKIEHPDALALRFLRARKWDVNKALVMMFFAMSWRYFDIQIDRDIVLNGEDGAVRDANGNGKNKVLGHDFMKQIRMGKSFVHGIDREDRPICVVRVRLHRASDQCVESIERYTTYLIETARLTLRSPVETANLIFDMTGFTLANMDYVPVKFIIQCFEANYPESLGVVLIHNAPWVFKGIWRVIQGWLDPVVASKIHFTYSRKDLEEFIAPEKLIKELGGDEDWEYKYEEPVPGENDIMKDTETKDRLWKRRDELSREFEDATKNWINDPDSDASEGIKKERERLIVLLRENYWELDPYIRARSLYDRLGNIRGKEAPEWYTGGQK